MIGKLVSIKVLIRKIVDDLGLGDQDIPWESMVDWIAHGLQHIGAYAQYERKTITLEVENYSSVLPDDFYRVDAAKFNTPHTIQLDTIIVGDQATDLELHYLALPVDEEGYPMIPGDPMYMDALFWKVASQLAMRGELRNKELTFTFCDQRWKRYCAGARAAANMPDLQGINRISNQFNKLKADLTQYPEGFATLGLKQILRRDGGV